MLRIKENNWIFFRDNYITDEDGKNLMRDYWTLPKRDIVKALANIAEGIVTMALKEDPDRSWKDIAKESAGIGLRAAGDVAPVDPIPAGESNLLQTLASQSHPFPKAWIEFAGGAEGQITDTWMGRELIPERFLKADPEHQKTESTEQGYVIVGQALGVSPIGVKKLVKTFTGNLIGQFVPKKPVEGRENWENNPLLRFFGQRFIAPNFIQDDKAKKWIDEELNKEANKNAIAGDAANKWIDERLRGQEIQIWDTKDDLILSQAVRNILEQDFPDRDKNSADTYARKAVLRKVKLAESGLTFDENAIKRLPAPAAARVLEKHFRRMERDWGYSEEDTNAELMSLIPDKKVGAEVFQALIERLREEK